MPELLEEINLNPCSGHVQAVLHQQYLLITFLKTGSDTSHGNGSTRKEPPDIPGSTWSQEVQEDCAPGPQGPSNQGHEYSAEAGKADEGESPIRFRRSQGAQQVSVPGH